MKFSLLIALLALVGCSTTPQTAQTPSATNKKTYSEQELQQTGSSSVAGQLQKRDADINVAGPHP